ncbi:MAG: M1 family aminopeptidase [Holophagaceae bacterium]
MKPILAMALFCFMFGGTLGAETSPIPDLRTQVQGLVAPTPGNARSITNWNLSLGKGQLRLAEGVLLPLMDNNREVGFYFKGSGVFTLPIDQDDEIPVVKFNVDRNTKAKLRWEGQSLFLDLAVREINLLYEGLQIQPPTSAEPQPTGSIQESLSAFRSKYLVPGWRNRSHTILTARHNAPAQAAWYMDILGDHGLWEFVRDPWTMRSEQLWFGRTRAALEGKGEVDGLIMVPISIRMVGTPARRPMTPPFILRHLDLAMEARTKGKASYVATETFIPQMAGMKLMNLSLVDTVFDASTNAIIPHKLTLKKVTQDGQPLLFHHSENELLLELINPTQVGSPIQLRFEVEGDFLIQEGGDNRWELGNEPWFPSTEFEGMRFTATAKIRCEKPFRPLASGQILDRREDGNFHVLETRIDQPTWSFFLVAGDYYFEEETRDGLTVRVASYAHKSANDRKLASLAHEIIRYYDGILGPFPVRELNVVQRNDWGSGQAPAGFLFITNEAFNPLSSTLNQWFSHGVNQRYAHEIAHQYWGNQVMIASREENWISEGFAQYASALAMRAGKGEGQFNTIMASWASKSGDQAPLGTIPTQWRARDLGGYAGYSLRWAMLYGKGPVLLHHIHKEVGDQAFVTLMRSFQKSLKGRPGTTQDLINLLKLIVKKDYTDFFEQHLWGTAMLR